MSGDGSNKCENSSESFFSNNTIESKNEEEIEPQNSNIIQTEFENESSKNNEINNSISIEKKISKKNFVANNNRNCFSDSIRA